MAERSSDTLLARIVLYLVGAYLFWRAVAALYEGYSLSSSTVFVPAAVGALLIVYAVVLKRRGRR
jgi:uncharacterized membrane protein YeaQ/YmgE (transglycosylase-associated protein family)